MPQFIKTYSVILMATPPFVTVDGPKDRCADRSVPTRAEGSGSRCKQHCKCVFVLLCTSARGSLYGSACVLRLCRLLLSHRPLLVLKRTDLRGGNLKAFDSLRLLTLSLCLKRRSVCFPPLFTATQKVCEPGPFRAPEHLCRGAV